MTLAEAAKRLGRHRSTVVDYIRRKRLRAKRVRFIQHRWVVDARSVAALLSSMKPEKEMIIEAWRDEKKYKRFVSWIERKYKIDMRYADWKGKDAGEPHPRFRNWLLQT